MNTAVINCNANQCFKLAEEIAEILHMFEFRAEPATAEGILAELANPSAPQGAHIRALRDCRRGAMNGAFGWSACAAECFREALERDPSLKKAGRDLSLRADRLVRRAQDLCESAGSEPIPMKDEEGLTLVAQEILRAAR